MARTFVTVLCLFLLPLVNSSNHSCAEVVTRKEWRDLSPIAKTSYIDAVQCILAKPALTPLFNNTGVLSRYDDLVYTHIQQTLSIHYVGHFLPWHRYFTAAYEHMLRTECGYTGAQPYWDWTRDVASEADYVNSPVFDSELGFGGNGNFIPSNESDPFYVPGRTGGGCVLDGPFAGIDDLVHLGPQGSVTYNPQCLRRDLSPTFAAEYLSLNQTLFTLSQADFGWFARVMEGEPSFSASGIHGGGHYGVGGTLGEWGASTSLILPDLQMTDKALQGQMGDLFVSPADPMFYREWPKCHDALSLELFSKMPAVHHANLDRVWWSWQAQSWPARLKEISGPIYLLDYDNLQGGNVTLSFGMSVGPSAPNVTVGDVMHTDGGGGDGIMCYSYGELYEF